MTLRKCILLQSHLESFIQMASDDPALKIVVPGLQQSLDDIGIIKRKLTGMAMSNVVSLTRRTNIRHFAELDENGGVS